jgi:hypothetical protein
VAHKALAVRDPRVEVALALGRSGTGLCRVGRNTWWEGSAPTTITILWGLRSPEHQGSGGPPNEPPDTGELP